MTGWCEKRMRRNCEMCRGYEEGKDRWPVTLLSLGHGLEHVSNFNEQNRRARPQLQPKSKSLRLYSGSEKQIDGPRSDRQSAWWTIWTEVHYIVQETGSKTTPKKKKCKKAKWLCEEALQIAVKRRDAKSKGEKERYTHLNAEFQRIARRDKKALLSDHCKEIEENNRMGKTRDLFKKIRHTKGTFHERWAR